MTTIYLVRHGDKAEGKDPVLSELGVRQAEAAGRWLASKNISSIISSPIIRTELTARIIAEQVGCPVTFDDRLRERFDWSQATGMTMDQFMSVWRHASQFRAFQPPFGESSMDTGNRVAQCIRDIAERNNGVATVLVSHGGAIMDGLRSLFGDEQIAGRRIDFFLDEPSTCSITQIDFQNTNASIALFESIKHLAEM